MTYSSAPSLPPVECLAAAIEAMRAGSFSTAANSLGVTHAAISRRVAGAEAWAGIKLFERHGRGVRPTPGGQRLLIRLSQQFEDIAALVARVRQPVEREVVRLALTPAVARFWLLPRLVDLEGNDLRIEILANDRHANLTTGEADLAIRYGRGNWRLGPEIPLFREMLVPICSSSSRIDMRDAQQVLAQPLIHSADTFLWRRWARSLNLAHKPKVGDRIVADYALAIDAALSGLGVALWNQGLHPLPKTLNAFETMALEAPPLRYFLVQAKGSGTQAASRLVERLTRAL